MGMLKKMYDLQKKKGKKGFSMIELIIVLAIMAILVALIGTQLIPYLEKSREKRDKTTLDTCKTAFESVVADYEKDIFGASTTGNVEVSYSDLTTDEKKDFRSYAGLQETDTPFKSKKAGTTSEITDIKFTYDAATRIMTKVEVNELSISPEVSATAAP